MVVVTAVKNVEDTETAPAPVVLQVEVVEVMEVVLQVEVVEVLMVVMAEIMAQLQEVGQL